MSEDFFNQAVKNTIELEKQVMPPAYKYHKFIRSPKQMGMTTKGSMKDLHKNISSLVNYGELLVSGKGEASTVNQPLGNKYFLKTGGLCRNEKNKLVDRYVYINNVPVGNIPLSKNSFIKFQEYNGLIPGMLQNLEDINTSSIFKGFMEEEHPKCKSIQLETINENNKKGMESRHIVESDLKEMNPCSFGKNGNPITGVACKIPPKKKPLLDQVLKRTEYGSTEKKDILDQKSGGGACPDTGELMAKIAKNGAASLMALKGGKNILNKFNAFKGRSLDGRNQFKTAKQGGIKSLAQKGFSSFLGEGFENKYDNDKMCKSLEENLFAKVYIILVILGLFFLFLKLSSKRSFSFSSFWRRIFRR